MRRLMVITFANYIEENGKIEQWEERKLHPLLSVSVVRC